VQGSPLSFFFRLSFALGLSALAFVQSAPANLIVNGDFELVGAGGDPASTFTTDYAAISTNTLTGWTSTISAEPSAGNYLSTAGSSANWIPDPFTGSYSMQLDSSTTTNPYASGNTLSQTVSLTANVTYRLTFYMSAEAARGQVTTSVLDVILNGGGFTNSTTAFTTSRTGTDTKATSAQWFVQTMDFTPSASGSISLTFQDIYTTNGTSSNASLDNVDLIAITPEIPSGLIAASFCAMVILSRKRKQLLIATIEQ
jgi:hypothetical protein